MSEVRGPEAICDYDGFDFASFWPGREKVTEVEKSLLAAALATADRRRLLEVGTGFGRLLGSLEALGDEVVATDFDLGSLARLPPSASRAARTLRIAANVYHLPFVDNAFTAATMVRMYHHLSKPTAAMSELRRILRPGGKLFVSYNPKPTVGTLVNDIQRAFHRAAGVPFRSITFGRQSHIELPPDPFPVHIGPREEFDEIARAVGFTRETEMVSGLEEYYLMRHVPTDLFVRVGTLLGRAPGFPMRFAVLGVPAGSSGPLPPKSAILACPRCRTPLGLESDANGVACPRCAFFGPRADDVLDLRFVSDGSPRWGGSRDAR